MGAVASPQDHDASLLREGGIAAVVIRNKERILERFCHRAQQSLKGARREPLPVLVDTLPFALPYDTPIRKMATYLQLLKESRDYVLRKVCDARFL